MAMKPTPTKVVLLMSAAGLGLSWSGAALASQDNNAPSFAWTFGIPPRSEQGCEMRAPDGLASCASPGGEILRTIVAEASALPLPLAPTHPSHDAKASFRAFDAYAARSTRWPDEARAGNGEPEPNNEAPRPDVPVVTRVIDGSSRDHETDPVAMVLLDDLPDVADAAATGSESPDGLAAAPQRAPDQAAAGAQQRVAKGSHSQALAFDTTAALGSERARADVQIAGVAVATPVHVKPSSAHEGKTTATLADDQVGSPSAFQADDRSAKSAQISTREDPTLSDAASIDRVFASLAEVLGSQLEELPPPFEGSPQQTAAPERDVADRAAVTLAEVDPVPHVSASPLVASSNDRNSREPSSEADDIVVASSHSDKILLSLAALRSGEGSEMGQFGAQTKKTVVVRHADKVLETLALFQSRTPKRAAFACTRVTEERTRTVASSGSLGIWEFPEASDASAITAFAHEPDILLDLSPPVADRPVEPVLQAALARPARPHQPTTGRSDRSAIGGDLVALSRDKLDEVRGGFVTDTGLKVSFGIERAVYLNGNLVTTTSLNVADLSKIAGGQAQVAVSGPGSLALVQSGAGNSFAPSSISSTAAGTVIQNTLDNQKINTITRIDAVVNSANIMRSINLQSSMRSAIINSLGR